MAAQSSSVSDAGAGDVGAGDVDAGTGEAGTGADPGVSADADAGVEVGTDTGGDSLPVPGRVSPCHGQVLAVGAACVSALSARCSGLPRRVIGDDG
ncbi:hypothetical protein GCM10009760_11200 [Kitasatospora kazusensis]|uniref:Uncharacterized protein n=1 Tax=Kitasatospora kazusensis TaxID=407974 RepID=A0ABN2YYV8_9ACTN